MKYIKKYELLNDHFEDESTKLPNYEIGDTVICRYKDENDFIKYGEKYIINDIYLKKDHYYVRLENVYSIYQTNKLAGFYAGKFILEHEWNANKYNL
jgi:hypothetical protein